MRNKVNSRMQGGWVMKAEDIAGLTPKEIQNKFALPTTPKYICDVELEAGTRLRMGEVNPLFGFEGGGQQYDLIINGKNVGTFTNERISGYDNVFCYTLEKELVWRIKPAPIAIGGTVRTPYVGIDIKGDNCRAIDFFAEDFVLILKIEKFFQKI